MRRIFLFVILLGLIIGIVGFQTGAYYKFETLFAQSPTVVHPAGNNGHANYLVTDTIINYGNGIIQWFNHSRAAEDWNFYNLTYQLVNGKVDSLYSAEYNEHQVLGINGLEQNATFYWSLWKFCPSHNAWGYSPVGADDITLSQNGIYGWYYQRQSGTQYPPVNGAGSVLNLDIRSC